MEREWLFAHLKIVSLKLSFDEVELISCPLWVQIHGLPLQNMTTLNAIKLGKTLGKILEVENGHITGIIYSHHLRIRVEIDTSKPLAQGFNLPRLDRAPIWVRFLYERLADYCHLCGLIRYKRNLCPAPPPSRFLPQYELNLKADTPSGSCPNLASNLDLQDMDHPVIETVSPYPIQVTVAVVSSGASSQLMLSTKVMSC
jgi:hypothetical protein